MRNSQTYFILSGVFLVAFLVVEFTSIYGDSGWFKVFALILTVTFFVSGIAQKRNAENDEKNNN